MTRAEAISALWRSEKLGAYSETHEAVEMAIEALQKAEQFEKAQIFTGERLNGRTYAYKCGLRDGKHKIKWIPVSEKLPEDGTWNLFTDGNMVSVERYKADAMDHFYPIGRWFSLDEAIAWMPLPEPYQTKSEDE